MKKHQIIAVLILLAFFPLRSQSQNGCCPHVDAGPDQYYCTGNALLVAHPSPDTLYCTTSNNSANYNSFFTLNSTCGDSGFCTAIPSMHIVVLDSCTLTPWNTGNHNFGNYNFYNSVTQTGTCRNRPENYFIFRMNSTAQMDSMAAMINNVPVGHYILAYSVFGGNFSTWNTNARNAFLNIGAGSIATVPNTVPYMFFTQKGYTTYTNEVIGQNAVIPISITLNLIPCNHFSYLWSPAADLNNPNSQMPVATPTATTIYTVAMTDTLTGCQVAYDTCVLFYCTAVGIHSTEMETSIKLFPNPVSETLHIEARDENISKLYIVDAMGRRIDEIENIYNKEIILSTSNYSPGFYTVHIETAKGVFVKKISVVR